VKEGESEERKKEPSKRDSTGPVRGRKEYEVSLKAGKTSVSLSIKEKRRKR
jgi:hypothetical protein